MAEVPTFRQSDFNNLELVRQVVLYRLKDQNFHQFDYSWGMAEEYIKFEHANLRDRFVVLANEVMWQFIIQFVITPGLNASNPNLPFFRVTDYGQKVLAAQRFIPHDPTGYLRDLQVAAKTTLGKVAIKYLEEALSCFNAGCHMASVLLLGIAAEGVFTNLSQIVRSSLKSATDQQSFDSLPDLVKPQHRWIVDKYSNLSSAIRRKQLPESLDITLTALYELIRRQRNELGHPQADPPAISREQAFNFFQMFPGYVSDVEAFADYCKSKGL